MQKLNFNLFELDLMCDACDYYIAETQEENQASDYQQIVIANAEKLRSRLMAAAQAEIEETNA